MGGLRTSEKMVKSMTKKTLSATLVDVNRELTEQISTPEVMWITVFPI